jgi:hypothetical protein
MKDVLFFIGFFATILLVAFLIPALFAAGYLRARRKGYRAPSAALVPLRGSAAGIFTTYLWAGRLPPRLYAVPLLGMWSLVPGTALRTYATTRIGRIIWRGSLEDRPASGPGAVVTFDDSGEGVIVARGANFPPDYIGSVRTRLIETCGYPAEQLNPPQPDLDSKAAPALSAPPAPPAISAPPASRPWLASVVWGILFGSGVLYLALLFRPAIPVLRDIAVAGGAGERRANEFYNRQQDSEALPYFERGSCGRKQRGYDEPRIHEPEG